MTDRSRTLPTALAIATSAAVLTGCSALRAAPYTPDLNITDIVYLNETRIADVEPAFGGRDDLITLGRRVCTSLATGTSLPTVVRAISDGRYPDKGSAVAVAAIHNYCPHKASLLKVPAPN